MPAGNASTGCHAAAVVNDLAARPKADHELQHQRARTAPAVRPVNEVPHLKLAPHLKIAARSPLEQRLELGPAQDLQVGAGGPDLGSGRRAVPDAGRQRCVPKGPHHIVLALSCVRCRLRVGSLQRKAASMPNVHQQVYTRRTFQAHAPSHKTSALHGARAVH